MSESELPGYLAAAWGLRERPSRGPKPGLTRAGIVAAAVALADAEGLAALSMSRIAAELGTKPMSLYRYVESKDELIVLMIEGAGGEPPVIATDHWRTGLAEWAWTYLAMLRAHPWVLQVPITGPPATPNQLLWLESGLRAMVDTNLTPGEKLSVVLLLSGYVRNAATLDADLAAHNDDSTAMMVHYGGLLARLVRPASYPELSKLISAGVFTDEDEEPDADFTFGLERILDGIEHFTQARASTE
ncbi:TetR/AcrR family transcriptional regulator [Actinokineospora sp. 24-640]